MYPAIHRYALILAATTASFTPLAAQGGNGKLMRYIASLPKQTVSAAERAEARSTRQGPGRRPQGAGQGQTRGGPPVTVAPLDVWLTVGASGL